MQTFGNFQRNLSQNFAEPDPQGKIRSSSRTCFLYSRVFENIHVQITLFKNILRTLLEFRTKFAKHVAENRPKQYYLISALILATGNTATE